MKISNEEIKKLIKVIGFTAQDGTKDIFYKTYNNHNRYVININFETQKIEYGSKIKLGDLTTSNFENSENFVVLECIDRLLEKGYSPYSIILEKKWPMGRKEKGKLDILVLNEDKKAYLMIECKTWGAEFEKEKKKMISDGGQLFSYYVQDKATKYLCLYASHLKGNNIEYNNEIIKVSEQWKELNNQKEIYEHWNKNFKENGIFESWVFAYDIKPKAIIRKKLKELTAEDSGKIFNQFAEILRHNIVSDKPNAFNKILNLFICKIIDENKSDDEEVDFQWKENDTNESLQLRLNELYKKGMYKFLNIQVTDYTDKDISDKLINIHEESVKLQIQKMFEELRLQKNPEFAFKEVYDRQSFLDNGIVVKEIVELLQPYQFRYGHKQQFLGDFFERLLNTSIKQEAGQYFTPVPIARFIVNSLPVKEIMERKISEDSNEIVPTVIDYAAGSGHFLTEYMDYVQRILNEYDTNGIRREAEFKIKNWQNNFDWVKDIVYGIEADYRLVKTTKVSSFLNGDGEASIILANGLDNFKKSENYIGKLREISKDNNMDNSQFDIVIANPPYSVASFKNTITEGEKTFELFNKLTDSSSEIESLFVERTKQLLKTDGYAGIILPSSILTNTSNIYISTREILLKYFNIKAIVELGSNTFMATGTNTIILFLERRDNIDYKMIEAYIESFFKTPREATAFGIEEAYSKYLATAYSNTSLCDYITLINKIPNEHIKSSEMFNMYVEWFNNLTEIKKLKEKNIYKNKNLTEQQKELDKLFYDKVFHKEKEKMLYFFLAYSQQTITVNVGEKQAEKEFLGYEFSSRRGYEGIKLLHSGTKLYDENNLLNNEKVNTYIYNSFLNKDFEIAESLKNNVKKAKLVDLIEFKQLHFNKELILSLKKNEVITSKWPIVTIGEISKEIINGSTPLKKHAKYWTNTNIPWITLQDFSKDKNIIESSTQHISSIALEENKVKLIPKNAVLISCTATIGKVAINNIPVTTNQQINSIICDDKKINYKYLYYYLKLNGHKLSDLPNNSGVKHVNLSMLSGFKLPLPPLDIQKNIVNDIEAEENIEYKNQLELESLKYSISEKLPKNGAKIKLSKIATMVCRGKSAKYGNSKIQVIKSGQARGYTKFDFSNKYYANDNYISDERNLVKGDILINSTGVGTAGRVSLFNLNGDFIVDSHITILRLNQQIALPEYVLFALANIGFKNIEKMANGQSGQIELALSTINNIEIILPSISEQQKYVEEYYNITEKINKIENDLENSSNNKIEFFEKYI